MKLVKRLEAIVLFGAVTAFAPRPAAAECLQWQIEVCTEDCYNRCETFCWLLYQKPCGYFHSSCWADQCEDCYYECQT